VAYHRANSPIHGACYMGDGVKFIDLPFLI
jgi:hypothetical protein